MWKKLIIGLISGIVSGFFSAGGGLILVPAFIYFLNMDEKGKSNITFLYIANGFNNCIFLW